MPVIHSNVDVAVVSVFTDQNGQHGNPLGIVNASPETSGREQQIATTLGFSETVFVDDLIKRTATGPTGRHDRSAVIRIFTPAHELPFAGHPVVGTSWWLASQNRPVSALQVAAGTVRVRYDGDLTWITGQPEWGPTFTWHEFRTPAEVTALSSEDFGEGAHYAWAWIDERDGHLRSRMFAPSRRIPEDEATGSAAMRLTAILGRDLTIDQGAGSRLRTHLVGDGAIEVGGRTRARRPIRLPL